MAAKENQGKAAPETAATKTPETKPATADANAATADAEGTGRGVDAVAGNAPASTSDIDAERERHAADLEQAVAEAEKRGYEQGLKDGGDAAIPEGSSLFTQEEVDASLEKARKEGYEQAAQDLNDDEDDKRAFRGDLMATIMLIPANLRRIRPEDRLNEMIEFLDTLKPMERRMAVPMIHAIALRSPDDIPSGRYKADVLNALNVIYRGESIDPTRPAMGADDQTAAWERLQQVSPDSVRPVASLHEGDPTPEEREELRLATAATLNRAPDDNVAAADRLASLSAGY